MAVRIEKAFGVSMEMMLRIQTDWDIAATRRREGEFNVPRYQNQHLQERFMHLREAVIDDASDIAAIHVRAWQQTYGGLVPQSYLDGMSIPERAERWRSNLQNRLSNHSHVALAFENKKPVGFISYGPGRDPDRGVAAEIYAVYVLREFCGRGFGYALFDLARQHFRESGFDTAYLWVMDTNSAAHEAYRRWGGDLDKHSVKADNIGGACIREITVLFDLA